MSLYAEYLKSRTEDQILEADHGFATYRFLDDGSVYILDIYVRPEFRKTGLARGLADQIKEIARLKGCLKMVGSVVPSAKGSTESLSVLIAYGMRLDSSTNNFILFSKEI